MDEILVKAFDANPAEKFSNFAPGIVLLDIGLPKIDGYAVAREIRRLAGQAPILLIVI